uniref:Uncharacterized protein n=1 Tax=Myotis myotis TaxID=51298 RepID=A0A7J7UPV3_MYOMY|nr:hypothetical protein mMyoMyo1_008604 [Myotis myotis]
MPGSSREPAPCIAKGTPRPPQQKEAASHSPLSSGFGQDHMNVDQRKRYPSTPYIEPVGTKTPRLIPKDQVYLFHPLASHSPAGVCLWGQSFPEIKFLFLEFTLAELTPLNNGARLACSRGLYVGMEMKAALQVAGLFEAPLDGVLDRTSQVSGEGGGVRSCEGGAKFQTKGPEI